MAAKTNIKVKLVGANGNAFNVMALVSAALKKAGRRDLADAYIAEATSGDYNHLLQVTMEYVDVE